jgi:hypothetical protein
VVAIAPRIASHCSQWEFIHRLGKRTQLVERGSESGSRRETGRQMEIHLRQADSTELAECPTA